MKRVRHGIRKGFTLLELTIVIIVGLTTGTMLLALFNQQLAFLNVYRSQNFLTEEAPVISLYVSRILGKADRFRLHDSLDDALSGENPRTTDSPVVVLNFRQPDGAMRATILAFEDLGSGPALYYYVVPQAGELGDPEWAVTRAPRNVNFFMQEGVLRMALTGPNHESVTYSGTMQQ